jgi:hypothetical protein
MNGKKYFRIGEYAVGGIISVQTESNLICIKALDWTSKKEIISVKFKASEVREIDNYLHQLTSSYWAEQIKYHMKIKGLINF